MDDYDELVPPYSGNRQMAIGDGYVLTVLLAISMHPGCMFCDHVYEKMCGTTKLKTKISSAVLLALQ